MILTKIKLVNWHAFENKTLSVHGNFAITGENGAGKSTLIDALYYVLSGGDKRYFNHAANSDAERTLETYILFKTGAEKHTYLRQKPVICHIALEFRDAEGYPSILGVVVDVGEQGTVERFYTAIGKQIEDCCFLDENNIPRNFDDLCEKLHAVPIKDKGTMSRRQALICQDFFHLSSRVRYMTLLKKALAFRPIDEVSSFVNDFLLEDIPINIVDLQNELQSYNEIYQMVKRTEEKINTLDRFMANARKYAELTSKSRFLKPLVKDADSFVQHAAAMQCRAKIEELDVRIEASRMQVDNARQQYDLWRQELHDLKNDGMLRAVMEAKQKMDGVVNQLEDARGMAERYWQILSGEQKIVRRFERGYSFLGDIKEGNYPLFVRHRSDWRDFQIQHRKKLYEARGICTNALNENAKRQQKVIVELNDLKSRHNHYRSNVEKLISLLNDRFKKEGGKHFVVRPLCEYLDIAEGESEWANAVEAFLGEDRFGLVFDASHYKDAVQFVHSQHDPTTAGVRLFQPKADSLLSPKFESQSLGAKLEVVDRNAKWICYHLLNKVTCVEDIGTLKPEESGVTKDCIIYRNWHYEEADPESYAYPYIGEDSFHKRMDVLLHSREALKEEERSIRSDLVKYDEDIHAIEQSRIASILEMGDVWQRIRQLEAQQKELQATIEQYDTSPDIFAKMQRISDLEKRIEAICQAIRGKENETGKLQEQKGSLASRADALEQQSRKNANDAKDMVIRLEDQSAYEIFKQSYQTDKGLDAQRIQKEVVDVDAYLASLTDGLKTNIRSYVATYNAGLSTSLEDIEDVIHEYERLCSTEIVNYKSKAEEARRNCEQQFRDSFITALNENIRNAKREIKNLNDVLAHHPFGINQERYRFLCNQPKDDEMREYYQIITSGKVLESQSLFEEVLDAKDQDIINRLFNQISHPADSQDAQRMLERYTDYRNYMSYDIEITQTSDPDNPVLFSKTRREKSGGETQTPFYIIIAACFDKLIPKEHAEKSTCPIIFDEAFNNMDETRINELLSYYKDLGIQVAIVVPTNRAPSVAPFMDTVIGLSCVGRQIDVLYVNKQLEVEIP